MTTVQSYLINIEAQLKSVINSSKFKSVTFGTINDVIEYPAIHFKLISMNKFDEVHLRNTTMQLRWELVYEVHILYAGLSNPSTWDETIESVNIALEIFINQMQENERLSSNAWWIEPSDVRYGVIEVDPVIDSQGVMGGNFRLDIKFLQNV